MFQYFNTIFYVHFRSSREGKSTSEVRNPFTPHPLNISLCLYGSCYIDPRLEIGTWVLTQELVLAQDTTVHVCTNTSTHAHSHTHTHRGRDTYSSSLMLYVYGQNILFLFFHPLIHCLPKCTRVGLYCD